MTKTISKKIRYIDDDTDIARRLGGEKRNPTSKRWGYKTELKNVA